MIDAFTTLSAIPRIVLQAALKIAEDIKGITYYPNLAEAIRPALDKKPRVIAFGEIHPDPGFSYRSTKSRFADEILPLLASYGIKDLVIEQILNDPKIKAELDRFFEGKAEIGETSTPVLFKNILYSDMADLIKMLNKCRELGIRVHAGGMTIAQAEATIKNRNYLSDPRLKYAGMAYNGKSTLARVNRLLASGIRQIAVYGGIAHNNITDNAENIRNGANYGFLLSRRLGNDYYEVDILPRAEIQTIKKVYGSGRFERVFPNRGAALFSSGNTGYLFFH